MIEKHPDASHFVHFSLARYGVTDIQNAVVSAVDLKDNSQYNQLFSDVSWQGKILTMKLKEGVADSVYRLDLQVTDQDSNVLNISRQVLVTDYLRKTYRVNARTGEPLTINYNVTDLVKGANIVDHPSTISVLLSYNGKQGNVFSYDVDVSAPATEVATIAFDTDDGNHYVFQSYIVVV